jgi:hypothetical protein
MLSYSVHSEKNMTIRRQKKRRNINSEISALELSKIHLVAFVYFASLLSLFPVFTSVFHALSALSI